MMNGKVKSDIGGQYKYIQFQPVMVVVDVMDESTFRRLRE